MFDNFNTGDIILFSDKSFIPSLLISYFTNSKYTHIGMILKDPTYIKEDLKGLYIFESTGLSSINDAEDNKNKFGVQIRKFEDVYNNYNGAIYWRKLNVNRNELFYKNIKEIHSILHGKPYDLNLIDWFCALFNIKLNKEQCDNKFFCSALISCVYSKLSLLDINTPWTIIRPNDFGSEQEKSRLIFINCNLEKEIIIKDYFSYLHYLYKTY